MDISLKITMADPAGNRTAFVEAAVPPSAYASIGAALLRDTSLRAEQVGFLCPPLRGAEGRLIMSGGEFCGNASRSFGLLLGRQRGKRAGDTVRIEASGSDEILTVFLEEDGAAISMPLSRGLLPIPLPTESPPRCTAPPFSMPSFSASQFSMSSFSAPSGSLSPASVSPQALPVVVFDGIAHVIAENLPPSQALAEQLIGTVQRQLRPDAAGAIFLSGTQMTPCVWVRETGSLIWESSCGSGTLAAAFVRGQSVRDGSFRLSLRQPGGILTAVLEKENDRVLRAQLSGPVSLEAPVIRTITII